MRMGEVVLSMWTSSLSTRLTGWLTWASCRPCAGYSTPPTPGAQTMLFSATLDDASVRPLVRNYQRQPVRHEVVSTVEEVSRATHRFRNVAGRRACRRLRRSGEGRDFDDRLRPYQAWRDRLARQLGNSGLAVAAIHGGHSQPQGTATLAASGPARSGPWSPRTWPPGECTSTMSPASSTTTSHPTPRTTCTARAVLPGRGCRLGRVLRVPDQTKAAAALARALDLDIEVPRGSSAVSSPSRCAVTGPSVVGPVILRRATLSDPSMQAEHN